MIDVRTAKPKELPKTRFGGGSWFPWKLMLWQMCVHVVAITGFTGVIAGLPWLISTMPAQGKLWIAVLAPLCGLIISTTFYVTALRYGLKRFNSPDKWTLK